MDQSTHRHGISWVGIMVIIVLLFLLGAVLFPMVNSSMERARSRGRMESCMSNQRQIALATVMFAQDNLETLPGALTWSAGYVSSFTITWQSEVSLSSKALHCPASKADMSYGMAADLVGGHLNMIPDANATDTLLSADAHVRAGSYSPSADSLLFSLADINRTIHYSFPSSGFLASFLDGHVEFFTNGKEGRTCIDAIDATAPPTAQRPSDILYQGADHLFVIDGDKNKVSGKSFTSTDAGRPYYFAFYYASLPKKGPGITIAAPGAPVTLVTPTQGKFYTIFVRPIDKMHKIAATLKGTTLTIINNAV